MPAPDLTDKYNTKLSDADEASYQAWAESSGRKNDTFDYDMRGAWKEGYAADLRGHFPDTFKKPNHPTFSDESKYHGKDGNTGGKWGGDDNAPTFTPSKTNLKNMSKEELQEYFSRVEPGAKIIMPKSRAQKRYSK